MLAFASRSLDYRNGRLEGRYGGRADRGMKKALGGMVAIGCGPRTGRSRYPVEVSDSADEDICTGLGGSLKVMGASACYLGLKQIRSAQYTTRGRMK